MTELSGHSEYLVAWIVYGVSAGLCLLVWWKLTSHIDHRGWRELLRGLAVVFLGTPWVTAPGSAHFAPAFLVLALDLLLEGVEGGMKGGIVLLGTTFVMLCLLMVRLVWMRGR